MNQFLALLLRCVLVLGLGFTPVANALSMAALDSHRQGTPPCHVSSHHQPDGKCGGATLHCHCAVANALPSAPAVIVAPLQRSNHPQTVHPLFLEQVVDPETPPPRIAS